MDLYCLFNVTYTGVNNYCDIADVAISNNRCYIVTHAAVTCERWFAHQASLDILSFKLVHYYYVFTKTVHQVWLSILLFTKHERRTPKKHMQSHRICRNTRCWHHHTISVQGIRNDDLSLSPVTLLVFLVVFLLFLSFLIP